MTPDKAAADTRLKIWNQKRKIPSKSFGWCGWYKKWYFRSILELSFVTEYLEPLNLGWQTGEDPKFAIPYVDKKYVTRNYFPDFFILDRKMLVECKPQSQHGQELVQIKKKAAQEFCRRKGYKYVTIDPTIISEEKLRKLHDTKLVKFSPETELKYKAKYEKVSSSKLIF